MQGMQIQTSRRVTEPREKTTAFVKAGGVKCRHRGPAAAQHNFDTRPRGADSFFWFIQAKPVGGAAADVFELHSFYKYVTFKNKPIG